MNTNVAKINFPETGFELFSSPQETSELKKEFDYILFDRAKVINQAVLTLVQPEDSKESGSSQIKAHNLKVEKLVAELESGLRGRTQNANIESIDAKIGEIEELLSQYIPLEIETYKKFHHLPFRDFTASINQYIEEFNKEVYSIIKVWRDRQGFDLEQRFCAVESLISTINDWLKEHYSNK